jgi:hypothetical protein
MRQILRRAELFCLVAVLSGCEAAGVPMTPTETPPADGSVMLAEAASSASGPAGLPAWILHPAELPEGRVGKNNCTFAFGSNVPQWDFHPDAGCWEHAGPDGWTRQQFRRLHIPNLAACGGGPGDAEAVRVCRVGGAGQPSPCALDPHTGPNGCARCVINPTCH